MHNEQYVILSNLNLGKFELRFNTYEEALGALASLKQRFPEMSFSLDMPESKRLVKNRSKRKIGGFSAKWERAKKHKENSK